MVKASCLELCEMGDTAGHTVEEAFTRLDREWSSPRPEGSAHPGNAEFQIGILPISVQGPHDGFVRALHSADFL